MEPKAPLSSFSFGEDGVTATVGASGRLLQISRHFPRAKYGYCVDHRSIPEPYLVEPRIQDLHSAAIGLDDPIGIDLSLDLFKDSSKSISAKFVNNRWPLFTIKNDYASLTIQYIVFNGVVYQAYELDFKGNQPPELSFVADQLIRELNFIDDDNEVNEDEDTGKETYKTELADDGTYLKRSHFLPEGREVAVFISPCDENGPFRFQNSSEGKTYTVDYVKQMPQSSKTLKITFAYDLQLSIPDINPSIQPCLVDIHTATKRVGADGDPFELAKFTVDDDLNEALRRNLEHILSVCSIPTTEAHDEEDVCAIALTCGDLDGHRVATAASFYCFEFLLLALRYFRNQVHPHKICDTKCYLRFMENRILKVCKGHVKWLLERACKAGPQKNSLSPHYWVNGDEIENWKENEYLLAKSLVDIPFQIIKIGGLRSQVEDWKPELRTLGNAVEVWVKELDQQNKLGCYAFPRSTSELTHNFYFTDHVLIWRAIKCVEDLGLKPHLSVSTIERGKHQHSKQSAKPRIYSSAQIQKQVLKRFTTENPLSKKRMLAVSRSPAQTRFLLRTRDAALFHAMDQGFFDKPGSEGKSDVWENKIDIWRNLIDCQKSHDDNDDTMWDEPLRFALSIILAQKNKCLNGRSVEEMQTHAKRVLLESRWSNGLFPGQVDENNEPAIYDDELMRDTYWGISFEIPYILWNFFLPSTNQENDNHTREVDSNEPKDDHEGKPNQKKPDSTAQKVESSSCLDCCKSLKEILEHQAGSKALGKPISHSMKHGFQFNSVVDQKNIVELSDEWLYNEPAFFNQGSEAAETVSTTIEGSNCQREISWDNRWMAIVDVPRFKHFKKNAQKLDLTELMTVVTDHGVLTGLTQTPRIPEKAKKRLYASFCSGKPDFYLYDVIISAKGKNENLRHFFESHTSFDKFFLEETAAELNTWTTELHLSFYTIDEKESGVNTKATSQSLTESISFPNWDKNSDRTNLTIVIMSFLFDGDFFDRYWTCYFLESDPDLKGMHEREKIMKSLLEPKENNHATKKSPWRQRRVLELLLFKRATVKMHRSSRSILKKMEEVWHKTTEKKDDLSYDTFLQTSNNCQELQQILQIIEKELAENLAKIEEWRNREKERAERPRWTFNDESRYRPVISRLRVQSEHKIQELKREIINISNFKIKITGELEMIRNDLDQRRANDIQRFTYVTVIFLPLGFATGVFSMSEAPEGITLAYMITTACVAFLLLLVTFRWKRIKFWISNDDST